MVVTGASSGIGKEVALLLSQMGAQLILIARKKDRLEAALQTLEGQGHIYVDFDLAMFSEYDQLFRRVFAQGCKVSGFVHCAGFSKLIPLRNMELEDLDGMMKVNYYAFMLLSKEFAKKKNADPQGASMVAISSIAAQLSRKGLSIYSATKSALDISVKALAQEYAPRNIRFNTVAPGWVATELTDKASHVLTKDRLENIRNSYPLGEGKPQDIARPVAFLLSEAAGWITGTTLTVDGGGTAKTSS